MGTDSSWVVDSAVLYCYRDFANDTAFKVVKLTKPDTIRGHVNLPDSLNKSRTGVWVPGTQIVGGYNPAFFVIWYFRQANSSTIKDEKYDDSPKWTAQVFSVDSLTEAITITNVDSVRHVYSVDTLLKGVAATATVDYDTLASIVLDTAEARQPGVWSATGAGVGGTGMHAVRVYARDTANLVNLDGVEMYMFASDGSTQEGYGVSNPGGFFTFQLDTGFYFVRSDVVGYFQAYFNDTIHVTGAQLDTNELYPYTIPLAASGSDSCNVVIYTNVPYSRAEIVLHGLASGTAGKPVRDTNKVWLDRAEIRPNPKADANGIIAVTLVRTAVTVPQAGYDIKIYNAHGEELALFQNHKIPSTSTYTLTIP